MVFGTTLFTDCSLVDYRLVGAFRPRSERSAVTVGRVRKSSSCVRNKTSGSRSRARILESGDTPPSDRDDVFGRHSVGLQRGEEAQWEVLVEEHLHEAWRTAGGRCAATCAAYFSAARTCSTVRPYSAAVDSTDSPAPNAPTRVATSMRVLAMHGLPNRTSGSIEMPGNTSIVDLPVVKVDVHQSNGKHRLPHSTSCISARSHGQGA